MLAAAVAMLVLTACRGLRAGRGLHRLALDFDGVVCASDRESSFAAGAYRV